MNEHPGQNDCGKLHITHSLEDEAQVAKARDEEAKLSLLKG